MTPYRPDEWTRIQIRVEPVEPPSLPSVHRFEYQMVRPTPEILHRAKRRRHPRPIHERDLIRPRDKWDFVFEGDGEAVELAAACFYSALAKFQDTNDRWIALHYLARCFPSPPLVRCARGDAPKDAKVPRLLRVSDEVAAARLSRELKEDRAPVLRVVSEARSLRERLLALGREQFHHEALAPLFRRLGLSE